jgi:hypothetical protein
MAQKTKGPGRIIHSKPPSQKKPAAKIARQRLFTNEKTAILLLFTVLLIGSFYFSLERVLYSDSSFILFRIINLGSLQPQEYRFGSFITQLFPLVGSKLHLPLSWIVLLYSASFNFFYLAIAGILVLRLKEYSIAILMSFYFVLFVSDTYYWITNEVHQAIGWMFLFFGLTIYFLKKNSPLFISIPIFLILGFLSIFTHPLVVFPVVFLWIFFLLVKKIPLNLTTIIFSSLLLVLLISKILVSFRSGHYDTDKLIGLREFSISKTWHSYTTPFVIEFLKRCLTNYWIVPILFFAGIYSAIRLKKYVQVLWVIIFSFVYFTAMCLTFSNFLPFYTESELMPATIIFSILFIYYTLPTLKPKMVLLILSGIFLVRLIYIAYASEKFTERKNWLYTNLETMRTRNIRKGIIFRLEMKQKEYLSVWAVPQESMIASALSNDEPNLTFVVGGINELKKRLPRNNKQILDAYQFWDFESLNKDYFSFDTTAHYQQINEYFKTK